MHVQWVQCVVKDRGVWQIGSGDIEARELVFADR